MRWGNPWTGSTGDFPHLKQRLSNLKRSLLWTGPRCWCFLSILENDIDRFRSNKIHGLAKDSNYPRPNSSLTVGKASSIKTEHELAGGLEDWEDINGGDVDRYGFITVRKEITNRAGSLEQRPPQRISTVGSQIFIC